MLLPAIMAIVSFSAFMSQIVSIEIYLNKIRMLYYYIHLELGQEDSTITDSLLRVSQK